MNFRWADIYRTAGTAMIRRRLLSTSLVAAATIPTLLAARDSRGTPFPLSKPAVSSAARHGTALANATMRNDTIEARALLGTATPADINAAQGDGMTALHWAAR